ncbi:histidine kinase [Microbacterium mitrae]|uniref:histidine kinase n=1 Tax=Microbacterium mitrae TaxID=664640 RepID=A0A5C8HTP4_9MICO|nr:histidine kinase [Microbacterium mitrae]TXK06582.1 hypothetical protein FVP60_06465 [Microbacterium mitrae]
MTFADVLPSPAAKRPWWRVPREALVLIACALAVMSVAGKYSTTGASTDDAFAPFGFFAAFPMLAVVALLWWRRRWPVPVTMVAIIATLIFPTTPFVALTALATATAVTVGRTRWLLIAGAFVATVVSLLWDVFSTSSLLAAFVDDAPVGSAARLGLVPFVPLIAALLVLPFAGAGFLRQYRNERDEARAGTAAAARNVAVLHDEVAREHERQEIARELHDTLAARLSAVSLHAGAFELAASQAGDHALAAARRVREAAQGSLDELRAVVDVLKNPTATRRGTGLSDLAGLIDRVTADGADVRAQVMVTDPASCGDDISHALYRILQESISNARRHAGGAAIRVDVRGGPQTGVSATISNEVPPGSRPSSIGGGNGLVGMQERAAAAGGSFQAGQTVDGAFRVAVWLPWQRQMPPISSNGD